MQAHPILFLLGLMLVISLFLFIAPASQAQANVVRARVRSVTGAARIYAGSQSVAFIPKRNDPLEPGNIIETDQNGRVVISLTDGGQITVLPNSKVVLRNFLIANSARELLDIVIGRVLVKIRSVGGKPNPYRLNSPAASIAVRGTEFIVDVQLSGETMVLVREGLVEVWPRNNPGNKRLVTPGGSVIVRPGGDISSTFLGPGSELNGRSRFYGDLGEDYQRSVDSVTHNSNEISPVFFSAFPDPHLDSLENPAYAAEFKNAEGRLLLLPSMSEPYLSNDTEYPGYSISSQMTFYTPIPGSRLVVGGSASSFDVKSRELITDQASFIPGHIYLYYYSQALKFDAFSASFIAAYSFGDHGKTSAGIGIDKLSGDGTFSNNLNLDYPHPTYGIKRLELDDSNTRFARTRLTFGLVHRFSESKKIGFYYRQGFNSSAQEYQIQHEFQQQPRPKISYFAAGKTSISTLSSEFGARFRASLTKRLFYGVEGSYLYERTSSRHEPLDQPSAYNHYLARRARFGAGLGFILSSRILLNFDIAGGLFNNNRPVVDPINLGAGYFSSSSYPGPLKSMRGASVSAHTAAQLNLWRNLFLSISSLTSVRKDSYNAFVYRSDGTYSGYDTYYDTYKDIRQSFSSGLGWKFAPNLSAEYLFSIDYRYAVPIHSLKLRYTFNLGVTREK